MATTRTSRTAPAAKATVVDAPFVETLHATHEQEEADLLKRVNKAFDDYMVYARVSFTKRNIIAWVMAMLTSGGLGYLLGSMLQVLMYAALAYTGSMFIMIVIGVIGFASALFVSVNAGTCVSTYIASGTAERHLSEAKGWVTGLFSRKPAVVR